MTTNVTTKENEVIFKSELLKNTVELAKSNGFQVYAFQKNEPITQIFIANESGVCTISTDLSGMLNIGTSHKPCRLFGTGFRLNKEPISELTIKYFENAIRTVKPYWAGNGEVIKYANWSDYLKTERVLTYFKL